MQLCQLGSASANAAGVSVVKVRMSAAEGRAAGVLLVSFSPWGGDLAKGSILAGSCVGIRDGAIQVR